MSRIYVLIVVKVVNLLVIVVSMKFPTFIMSTFRV